jgi:hypothetical protein
VEEGVRRGELMDESMRGALRHLKRQEALLQGESLSKLRDEMTEAELVERYDALVEEAAAPGKPTLEAKMMYLDRAQVYIDELTCRENVRQGKRMEKLTESLNKLTWWIVVLTVVIAVATLVGVGVAVWVEFFSS